MRRIFIDGGAHKATSVQNFKTNYPDAEKYEIFSFEGNSGFRKHFDEHPDVKLEVALVWTKDGEQTFFNAQNESSSVYKAKAGVAKKVTVKSIDLDNYIKQNFDKQDEIILKLDIEGAEYEVLEHMIKNGSIEYVNKLFIEWHCAKVQEISVKRHLSLLSGLADNNIAPYCWSHTRTKFDDLAIHIRDIARNNNDLANFKKHESTYNEVVARLKEVEASA
tara:strand:+ start:1571 stop:2230 length:660 start_codon:yes stop_codon:yes gene_type:complete